MSKKTRKQELAAFLKARRDIVGLTQVGLSDELRKKGFKASAPTIAHWESTKAPTKIALDDPDFLAAIAEILGTTPQEIYEVAGILETGKFPTDSEDMLLIKLFRRLNAVQKQAIKGMLESFIGRQHFQE